ncbi:hypothetical protein [Luethyella okanaganae]|uniref:Uncharacterized protein n=1 Tax=Luethyella okanaganae TaxID=69372 RepID=A0ABW1VIN5_9MICO
MTAMLQNILALVSSVALVALGGIAWWLTSATTLPELLSLPDAARTALLAGALAVVALGAVSAVNVVRRW